MPTILSAKFVKWDGDRCYVDVSCTGLTALEHYIVYPVYQDKAKASWGFRPPETNYTVKGYIVGSKIDSGDCDVSIRLCLDGDPDVYVDSKKLFIPPKAKPTCSQNFYVKHAVTNSPIVGALCHITSGLWCVTGADGKCTITLNEGDSYSVTISHDDFVSQDQSFIACATVSKSLTPKPCSQKIIVTDSKGNVIRQATVVVDGTTKYTSLFGAPCSFTLLSGVVYEAVASKTGFVCLVCRKSFTACASTITLTLQKPAVPTADITFDSTPKGAEVTVDGVVIGNT